MSSLHTDAWPGSGPCYFQLRKTRLQISELQNTITTVSTSPHNITNLQQGEPPALSFTELEMKWSVKIRKDKNIFGISKEQQNFWQPHAWQANDVIVKYASPTYWNHQSYKNLKVRHFMPVTQLGEFAVTTADSPIDSGQIKNMLC